VALLGCFPRAIVGLGEAERARGATSAPPLLWAMTLQRGGVPPAWSYQAEVGLIG